MMKVTGWEVCLSLFPCTWIVKCSRYIAYRMSTARTQFHASRVTWLASVTPTVHLHLEQEFLDSGPQKNGTTLFCLLPISLSP